MNKLIEEKYVRVEKSIIKKFRKEIWTKFIKAIKQYELVKDGDKIAVCMSGGKDSMLLAKCIQELHKYSNINFQPIFLVMDPGYNQINRSKIEENSKLMNIPIKIFETQIFDIVANLKKGSPCYICARMRRGNLYYAAQKLGCNKIALGHHYDDVIETILMSMMYNGEIKTMMPKLKSSNFDGMELIRPLYLVREEKIIAWQNYNELEFINCACRFLENCSVNEDSGGSKRAEVKRLLKSFRTMSPLIEKNIFKSAENVNLNSILGYKTNQKKITFLDDY